MTRCLCEAGPVACKCPKRPRPLARFFRWLWCCHCLNCELLSTPEGIGGQCVECGEVHGWVTREELRSYAKRERLQ